MIRELYQFEYQPGVRFAFSAPEHFQGTTLRRIVDTATGVLYLQAITDQGISITPLLEVDGEPLVQDPYLRVQLDALSDWKGISRILEAMKSRKYWYQERRRARLSGHGIPHPQRDSWNCVQAGTTIAF